ncbi:MAG: pyridine nucleotide-disulfide oxidoreductase [Deltaproteobacteria bacterium]|nr:MAG: pyridine nucleotide-disulfide oxidoreductase [Deltaproteobacteria bacterium]
MAGKRIVVIGGVACGPKAAARIKRLAPDADVTIIEKGELLSYAGCGLPFYLSGEVHDHNELMATPTGVVRDTQFFQKVKGIRVLNKTLAQSIDRENKVVHAISILSGESVELPYDTLVLAVGSKYYVPPIPGTDLKGVHFLQTIEDAQKIRNQEREMAGKRAVIIGGGLIGIEVTEAFVRQGLQVTVIEKGETILGELFDPEVVHHVHGALRAGGVDLKLSTEVTTINGDDRGKVVGVTTTNGVIKADMVLIAVGVKPNTRMAEDAGLALGETGAIRVDEQLRTSDPHIFAGGDCVENRHLVHGGAVYAPMGSTANKHGRVIADTICGVPSRFTGILGTIICKAFSMNMARTGLTEKEAKERGYDVLTVLNPSPDKAHFLSTANLIIIKFVVDRKTAKLLGAQIVGPGDVAKRIEIAISHMAAGGIVTDIGHYDLAYAPPFSPAMDNIITTANIAGNKLAGIGNALSPIEVKAKMDAGEDFLMLDVRSPQEYEQMRIEDERVKLIPLGKLRSALADLPRDKEIVAYCKISLRGYEAERILVGEGFTNVAYMDGGLVCWPYKKIVNA